MLNQKTSSPQARSPVGTRPDKALLATRPSELVNHHPSLLMRDRVRKGLSTGGLFLTSTVADGMDASDGRGFEEVTRNTKYLSRGEMPTSRRFPLIKRRPCERRKKYPRHLGRFTH